MNPQQTEILATLREMGDKGINSFLWRDKWVQLPVRISELKNMGYPIRSQRRPNKSVDYILETSEEISAAKQQMVWVFNNRTRSARQVTASDAQRMVQEGWTQ